MDNVMKVTISGQLNMGLISLNPVKYGSAKIHWFVYFDMLIKQIIAQVATFSSNIFTGI